MLWALSSRTRKQEYTQIQKEMSSWCCTWAVTPVFPDFVINGGQVLQAVVLESDAVNLSLFIHRHECWRDPQSLCYPSSKNCTLCGLIWESSHHVELLPSKCVLGIMSLPRPTKSEILGIRLSNLGFNKTSGWFWGIQKFKIYWSTDSTSQTLMCIKITGR